jgi:SAM-dependent methyltransferase
MRDAGWEATGIDLSPTAIAYARQRFGLQVFEGQLADAGLAAEQFTAATLWDVLEHTFNPLETLQTLHRLLETDGIVVITVPHYESWDRLIFGRQWIGYDAPRHLYVFTRTSLCSILRQAGFEVESMRCAFGGYFTTVASLRLWFNAHVRTPVLREALYRLISIHGVRFLFSPWDLLVDKMGRGNKLEVIGRKVIK